MNCPYCDESIALSAKFCPKCGLPLKEDATLMGASWGSGDGPNKWIIAGGAAGILAVALSIGWMVSHGNDTAPKQVGVQTLTPIAGGVTPYQTAMNYNTPPLSASPFQPASSFTSFGNKAAGWAPPQNLENQPKKPVYVYQEPEAPSVPLFRWQFHTPVQPAVRVAQSDIAPMPDMPPAPQWEAPAPPAPVVQAPAPDARVWVWDPVQERYAMRAEVAERRARRPAAQPQPQRPVASQELIRPQNEGLSHFGPLLGTQ